MLWFFLVLLAWFFVELLQSFGIFFLQNAEVDLYTDILELAIFWLKNRVSTYTQVRLIHQKIRYLYSKVMHAAAKWILLLSL